MLSFSEFMNGFRMVRYGDAADRYYGIRYVFHFDMVAGCCCGGDTVFIMNMFELTHILKILVWYAYYTFNDQKQTRSSVRRTKHSQMQQAQPRSNITSKSESLQSASPKTRRQEDINLEERYIGQYRGKQNHENFNTSSKFFKHQKQIMRAIVIRQHTRWKVVQGYSKNDKRQKCKDKRFITNTYPRSTQYTRMIVDCRNIKNTQLSQKFCSNSGPYQHHRTR